jgi:hypothetical protein
MNREFGEVAQDQDGNEHRVIVIADPMSMGPGQGETWRQTGARFLLTEDRRGLEPVEGDWKHLHLRAIGTDRIFVLKRRP